MAGHRSTLSGSDLMERGEMRGHRAAVNDIAAAAQSHRLATASDDGTVRLWDANTNKAVKCFREFFTSPPQLVRFSSVNPHVLFAADERNVYVLDDREDGMVVKIATRKIDRKENQSIDINALSIGWAAVCVGDDDGRVTVFDTPRMEPLKLEGVHTNLVGSLAMGTTEGTRYVYSGGFDSRLVKWDIAAGREMGSFNFGSFYTATTNPPFVHSLSLLSLEKEESHIICALGNGRLCLMDTDTLSPTASVEASGGMINALITNENRVISAGNSGLIKLFDVEELESTDLINPKLSASQKKRLRKKGKAPPKGPSEYAFRQRFSFNHTAGKVNAIAGFFSADCCKLYVADTAFDVSVYTINWT